jgi:hypothetical protein
MKKSCLNFGDMKKRSTFAAIHAKNHIDINSSGYFYGYTIAALLKDIRLSNPCRLLHLCRNDSWRNMGGDSLSLCKNFYFHRQMPRINENASKVNNSSRTSTSTGTKSEESKSSFDYMFSMVLDLENEVSKLSEADFITYDKRNSSSINDMYEALREFAIRLSCTLSEEIEYSHYFIKSKNPKNND